MYNFGGAGGRSDLVKKGRGIFSKFRGELAKRGSLKIQGVWTLDEAMSVMRSRWSLQSAGCQVSSENACPL